MVNFMFMCIFTTKHFFQEKEQQNMAHPITTTQIGLSPACPRTQRALFKTLQGALGPRPRKV